MTVTYWEAATAPGGPEKQHEIRFSTYPSGCPRIDLYTPDGTHVTEITTETPGPSRKNTSKNSKCVWVHTSNTRNISLLYRHNILTTSTPTQTAHTPYGEVGCYPLTPTGTQAHQDATSGFNFAMVNLTTLGETEFRNENGTKLRSGRNNLLDLTIVHAPSTAGRGYGFLEYVAEAAERKWGYGAVVGIVVNPRKSIQAPTLLPTESMYQIILDEIRDRHHWDIPQEYDDTTVGWWMSLYGMIIRDDSRPVPPLELRSGLWKPGYHYIIGETGEDPDTGDRWYRDYEVLALHRTTQPTKEEETPTQEEETKAPPEDSQGDNYHPQGRGSWMTSDSLDWLHF
jgi:hypothetical protein